MKAALVLIFDAQLDHFIKSYPRHSGNLLVTQYPQFNQITRRFFNTLLSAFQTLLLYQIL